MDEKFYRKGIVFDPQLSQQYDRFHVIGQPGWRFCDKCWGIFFNGDPNIKGHSPAGGAHHAQGFQFVLPQRRFPNPSRSIPLRFLHRKRESLL